MIICILLAIDTVLLALLVFKPKRTPVQTVPASTETPAPDTHYGMSESEFKSFAESDVESVKEFQDALATLNAFMTGNEENRDVEQQEF